MLARFKMKRGVASNWAKLGQAAPELHDNVVKFAPDWRAAYDFTRLPEAAASGATRSARHD